MNKALLQTDDFDQLLNVVEVPVRYPKLRVWFLFSANMLHPYINSQIEGFQTIDCFQGRSQDFSVEIRLCQSEGTHQIATCCNLLPLATPLVFRGAPTSRRAAKRSPILI